MADGDKKPSDVVVLKNFFGYRQGESLSHFSDELKQLSPDEKAWLADGIRSGTFTY